jgi:hypothetical protein
MAQHDPLEELPNQSLNILSKAVFKSTRKLGYIEIGGARNFFDTILNISIPAFLDNKDVSEKFSRFVSKVSSASHALLDLRHLLTCIVILDSWERNDEYE